jgi:hypothetical protein
MLYGAGRNLFSSYDMFEGSSLDGQVVGFSGSAGKDDAVLQNEGTRDFHRFFEGIFRQISRLSDQLALPRHDPDISFS